MYERAPPPDADLGRVFLAAAAENAQVDEPPQGVVAVLAPPAESVPTAWMCPRPSLQIQTSCQASGMTRLRILASSAASVTGAESGWRYEPSVDDGYPARTDRCAAALPKYLGRQYLGRLE
jgi:hypothetical protein